METAGAATKRETFVEVLCARTPFLFFNRRDPGANALHSVRDTRALLAQKQSVELSVVRLPIGGLHCFPAIEIDIGHSQCQFARPAAEACPRDGGNPGLGQKRFGKFVARRDADRFNGPSKARKSGNK